MKKVLLMVAWVLGTCAINAQVQIQAVGNTITSVVPQSERTSRSREPEKTPYTWRDPSTGIVYDIYIGSTGSCFTLREIKSGPNKGKMRKDYNFTVNGKKTGPEVSAWVCKKLNREYTPRTRN